jgi:hypothetical protein
MGGAVCSRFVAGEPCRRRAAHWPAAPVLLRVGARGTVGAGLSPHPVWGLLDPSRARARALDGAGWDQLRRVFARRAAAPGRAARTARCVFSSRRWRLAVPVCRLARHFGTTVHPPSTIVRARRI